MDTFFNPESIAVVGASRKENLGNAVVTNLKAGFKGPIYPIHPSYTEIEGLASYASISATPGPVDLAIILVPAPAVPAVLQDCAAKGTRRVIIQSAGFSETGPEGHKLQQACNRIAEQAGIRLWGPNCMGIVNVPEKHYFSFMDAAIRDSGALLPGRISLIVQSGMMSAIFLAELGQRGIGVAKACSIGNRADVDECDIIPYLEKDPDTDVIALYLESIPRGRLFTRLVRNATKPIVLLKGGKSQAGAAAAMSHTSSLSGDSRLLGSILSNSGVSMADSIFQMMDLADTLSKIPNMNPAGRIAVMSLSGGAGILACDALERKGLTIATLSAQTKEKLSEVFPPWMPPANPIDLFPAIALRGGLEAFRGALAAVLTDPQVDVVVMHIVTGLKKVTLDYSALKKKADLAGKTLVIWLMGLSEGKKIFKEKASKAGIVVHSDAERLAECLQAAAHFNEHRQAETNAAAQPAEIQERRLESREKAWDEFDSKKLLRDWKIPVVMEEITSDPEQAADFARKVRYPIVLKGLVPEKTHKTEHGLVKLGIGDLPSLQHAFETMQRQLGKNGRILIQKQEPYDYELIAGFLRDDQFGPCVMFGIGGILAELEPDVSFAPAPLTDADARKLIRTLRNCKLVQGFRRMAPLDESAMAQLLVNLGNLGSTYPQITQIDINPLLVYKGAPVAVDANVILK